jgi:death on curing protein
MPVHYITIDQAIEIHEKTVDKSGGGLIGHLELWKLEGVLENIKNDVYYPTVADKLTHLFFSACKFHSFLDGNKRIAIILLQFCFLPMIIAQILKDCLGIRKNLNWNGIH